MVKDYDDSKQYFLLKDAANAFQYGNIKSDLRIQVKMPSFIVKEIDKEFPSEDRSAVITKAAIELLLRKKRISDPSLEHWQMEEQYDMDRMWDFLEEIENED